jgi:hypothetical protein
VAIVRLLRSSAVASATGLAALLVDVDVGARSAPVIVTVVAEVPVRVQIALAPEHALPCDASENTMVFDGMVDPRVGLALSVEMGPLCVQHTFDDFPESHWGKPQLWIKRYDSPLRIALRAHAS